jgi:hypothetical protein
MKAGNLSEKRWRWNEMIFKLFDRWTHAANGIDFQTQQYDGLQGSYGVFQTASINIESVLRVFNHNFIQTDTFWSSILIVTWFYFGY